MKKRAFTIIEIMLVIGIIGTLAGIVIGAVNPNAQLASAQDAKRRSDARSLQNAIDQYLIDTGTLPNESSWPDTGSVMVCKQGDSDPTCISMDTLIPDYLSDIPADDSALNSAHTGYTIKKDANDRPTVTSAFLANGQIDSPNDYLARWSFEDGPGSAAASDVSGNGYTATLTAMDSATDWVSDTAYNEGYALNFDGVNDQLDLAKEITLTDDFTIFIVFDFQNIRNAAWRTFASGGTNPTHIVVEGGGDRPVIRGGSIGTQMFDAFSGVDNGLEKIALRRVGSTVAAFYNGQLQATTRTVSRDLTIARLMRDGLSGAGGADAGGGNLYDFRIYDRALSAEEITALSNGT